MHPDDTTFEAQEPARIVPDQVYEIAYKELIEELRHNLSAAEDEPVPVYPFAYDWRQPLAAIQQSFGQFVDEVVQRTALMKHYYQDGYDTRRRVNVVGHSMGGLVIAGYLADRNAKTPIEKVVTLAAPFRGSIEALVKTVTGDANLGASPPSSRERESSRMTPSLYHLLPSFTEGIVIDKTLKQSLFDSSVWQKSIKDTIVEYARLYGREPDKAAALAPVVFDGLLATAARHRAKLENFKLSDAGLSETDWLCVVGVDTDTRVHLTVVADGRTGPEFRFDGTADIVNDWEKDSNGVFTGDGTVPFAGAIPGFLPRQCLVCVTPDDFAFTEFQDRLLAKAAGFHGILPNMNMLHRLIVRFFNPDARGDYWGRPPPGVKPGDWKPPFDIPPR
jgi:pimeloyl-ACP methyl ester carboxylesterase